MKETIASRSGGMQNWPLGLFRSETILASNMLGAAPTLMVRSVAAWTSRRSSATTSSTCISCSAQYPVTSRYASSRLRG